MKDLKRKTTRPRKRLIAILLSVLMVMSICLPSGGSGVRYNAYAEGEESAQGEGVDVATSSDAVTTDADLNNNQSDTESEESIDLADSAVEDDLNDEILSDIDEINLESTIENNEQSFEVEDASINEDRPLFYSASVDGLSVVATPTAPTTFPEGVRLVVTPINSGNAYDAYMKALGDKTSENGKLYDIAFIYDTEEGTFEYEPEEGSVQINFLLSEAKLDEIGVESVDELEVIHLPLVDSAKEDGEKTIEADFSASDVIVDEIKTNVTGENTVSFSTDSFSTYYITDGGSETDNVSDASKTRLENFIKDAVLTDDGTKVTSVPWVVRTDRTYGLSLSFAENPLQGGIQFDTETGTFSYILPQGIASAATPNSPFTIEVTDNLGVVHNVTANTYGFSTNADGRVVITGQFDKTSEFSGLLNSASNTKFQLDFDVTFSNDADSLDFGYGVTKNVTVDNTNNVKVEKSGSFDNGDGTATFVVNVTSNGNNSNVIVNDTVTGTAFSNVNITSVKASNGNDWSYTTEGSQPDKGFNLNLGSMTNGQKVIITYKADVNLDNITGKGTVSETSNTVKATSTQDPTGDQKTTNLENNINYTSFSKSGKASDNVIDGKRTVSWKVVYNAEKLKSMKGNLITDTIDSTSQQYMSFDTNMTIKITREDKSGVTTTETITPTSVSGTQWTYKIPDDETEVYKYTIEYEAIADVSSITSGINVSNTVKDNNGFSDSKGASVGPESGNELGISKQVKNVNQQETEWVITVQIPATSGLAANSYVEEVLPFTLKNNSPSTADDKFEDTFVDGSISAELDGVEFTNYNVVQTPASDFWTGNKVTIYFPNGVEANGSTQYLVITLKSNNNQDWLEYAIQKGGNYPNHDNHVSVKSANTTKSATATSVPVMKYVEKTAEKSGNNWAGTLPTYKYVIKLYGITSDMLPLEVVDDYDDKFTLGDNTNNTGCSAPTIAPYNSYGAIGSLVPIDAANINDDGTKTVYTITDSMLQKQSNGLYYSEYSIEYFLVPDSIEAYNSMIEAAITDPNSQYVASNTVSCSLGSASNDLVTYSYTPATKTILNPSDLHGDPDGINRNVVFPQYQIVINPDKERLNNGNNIVATDTIVNQSFEYDTITYETDPEGRNVTYDASGSVLTITVPDETKVTLTYSTRITVTSTEAQNVHISNTFNMKGQDVTAQDDVYVKASSSGTASIYSIKVLKYKYGDMHTTLNDAVFGIYNNDGTPVYYKSTTTPATVTTSTVDSISGIATINNVDHDIYVGSKYYVQEISAPPGYMLDNTKYYFTIAEDNIANYDEWIYSNNDILKIRNGGAKLQFTKVDENSDPLGGAVFGLYSDSTATTPVLDSDNNPITATSSSEAATKGEVTFWNLYLGTYYVKEISAPEGYEISDTIYTVNVTQGTDSLEMTSNIPQTVSNERISNKGKITVTKNITKNGVSNSDAVGTFKVGISTTPSLTDAITDDSKIKTISVTAGTGTAKFTELDNDTYYIYELDEDNKPVGESFGAYEVTGSGTAVTISDSAKDESVTITNNEITGNIAVTKHVTFDISEVENVDTYVFYADITLQPAISGTFEYEIKKNSTTKETGNITFNNGVSEGRIKLYDHYDTIIKDLPVGTSVNATEFLTDAEGKFSVVDYSFNSSGSTVEDTDTVAQNTVNSVVLVNNYHKDKGQLTISKIKKDGSKNFPAAPATFPIKVTFDKNVSVKVTVGDNSEESINFTADTSQSFNLPVGKNIVITEIPAGTGYTVEEAIGGVAGYEGFADPTITYGDSSRTIAKDDTDIVTVENNFSRTGNLVIHKKVTGDRNWDSVKKYITFEISDGSSIVKTVNGEDDGWTNDGDYYVYTVDDLDITKTYTVAEVSLDSDPLKDVYQHTKKSGTSVDPATEETVNVEFTATDYNKNAYFINNYELNKGSFTVKKEGELQNSTGDDSYVFDVTKDFEITVSFTFPTGVSPTGSYKIGDSGTDTPVTESTATIHLKKDDIATFSGIPYGTKYTVSEQDISAEDLAEGYMKDDVVYSDGSSFGKITADTGNVNVVVNNKRVLPVKGYIVITKTVSGTGNRSWYDIDEYISFKVTNEDGDVADISGLDPNWNISGNVATYQLTNLTLGKTYKVEEIINGDPKEEYYELVKTAGKTSTLTPGDIVDEISLLETPLSSRSGTANFENSYTRKTGSLEIIKAFADGVTYPDGYENVPFTVTVTLKDDNGNNVTGTYGGVVFADGKADIVIKANAGKTINDIPYGYSYIVTEKAPDVAGYSIVDGEGVKNGNINTANQVATVKNTYSETTGSIVIKKTFTDDSDVNSDDITSGQLRFEVTCDAPNYSATYDYKDDFTGGSISLSGLQPGTYKVKEISAIEGTEYIRTTTVKVDDGTPETGDEKSVAIAAGDSKTVEFINTYTHKTGTLKVNKVFKDSSNNEITDVTKFKDITIGLYSVDAGVENFVESKMLAADNVQRYVEFTGLDVTKEYKVYEGTFNGGIFEKNDSTTITLGGKDYAIGYDNATGITFDYTASVLSVVTTDDVTITNTEIIAALTIRKLFDISSVKQSADITSGQIKFDVRGEHTGYHEIFDFVDGGFIGGELTIAVEPDTYTITETSTIEGSQYERTTNVKLDGVDKGETDSTETVIHSGDAVIVEFTNKYTVIENGKIVIKKSVTGLPDNISSNKEFKLVIEYKKNALSDTQYVSKTETGYGIFDAEPTGTAVPTIKAGVPITITDLPYGTYKVKEVTGDAAIEYYDYMDADSEVNPSITSGEVVVASNDTKTVELINNYVENRTVGISKYDITGETAKLIGGAKLTISEGSNEIATWTSNDIAPYYVNGLKSGVVYSITETSAPDGYVTVKNATFIIDNDNNISVTPEKSGEVTVSGNVINVNDKKTVIKISKVDITNEKELPGAVIQILDKDGNVVTDENGNKLEWTSTTEPKEIVGLKTGVTYTLRETVAPDGYQIATDTVFKLNKDGTIDETATTTTVSKDDILLVEDAPLGAFAVNKKGYVNELCSDDANITVPLKDVEFTLTKPDDTTFGQTKATDEDGIAAFTGLQPGTYELRETKTIDDYIIDMQVYTIKINADGSNDGLRDESGNVVEGNIIINDVPRTNIKLIKVSLSNKNVRLPGSKYGLFKKSADNKLTKIAESITDDEGLITFEGVLTSVEYVVQELESPDGYYVSEEPVTISFKLDDNGNVVIDKIDDGKGTIVLGANGEITWLEPQVEVSFVKQDTEGNNLPGAKLKVVDSNGNDVISWTSTTESYLVNGILIAGETYKLVEVEAPEGYEIAEPITFTIERKAGSEGADVISIIMQDKKDKTKTTSIIPPEKSTPPSVKTEDTAPIKPVTSMMFISLAGIVYLLIFRRKRKNLFK